MLEPGDRLGSYVVEEELGHGGYAVVYRGRDTSGHGRSVALKVLDERHRRPADLARLQREFRFSNELDHPHVVRVYEAGPHWLAMELVDGLTAANLPTVSHRLTALAQIADALDYTHRRGIVHGDVKPSNILVRDPLSQLNAVLIDFGVAHSLAEDVAHHPARIDASLPYSAPELLHGRTPSPAVDEYALACTAVELITGAPPFTANTQIGLIDEQLNRPPPRLSRKISWIPHAFDSILAKAMAKSPDSRYNSCGEFVSLITRALR